MQVSRLRELSDDMRVAAASAIVTNSEALDVERIEALDILAEIASEPGCPPGRRTHILNVVSVFGLRGVERLCIAVSMVSLETRETGSKENLRRVVAEMAYRLCDADEYPGYLEALANYSLRYVVSECDRTGSFRYAGELVYCYSSLSKHASDREAVVQVSKIMEAVAFY